MMSSCLEPGIKLLLDLVRLASTCCLSSPWAAIKWLSILLRIPAARSAILWILSFAIKGFGRLEDISMCLVGWVLLFDLKE